MNFATGAAGSHCQGKDVNADPFSALLTFRKSDLSDRIRPPHFRNNLFVCVVRHPATAAQ
jgi:hypothetical protein